MTFKHKLSRRLALLRAVLLIGALGGAAACDLNKLVAALGAVIAVLVSPATPSVGVGATVQLTATPLDALGNVVPVQITWASGNPAVAMVSSSGLVTGMAAGSTPITAASGSQSGTAAVTVTAAPPPSACTTASTTWQNTAFATQTGSFTVQFDATPNAASIDGVTGLSQGAAAAYTDLAVAVRFNTGGQIDARNGSVYAAANVISYTAGSSYHFRLAINVASHTYSAYVTPPGGTEATIGAGFAFRIEQSTVTSLANWAVYDDIGTHTVCNLGVA